MRVLNPIQSQEEPVPIRVLARQQVLNPKELPLANHSQNSLMSIRPSQPRKLLPRLNGHPNTRLPAQLDQPLQPLIPPLPCHAYMLKPPSTRPYRLLDSVETVKNFHA